MNDVIRAIGGIGALLVVPWVIFMLCVTIALPFMCISVVRNIARIRRALEQIAERQFTG